MNALRTLWPLWLVIAVFVVGVVYAVVASMPNRDQPCTLCDYRSAPRSDYVAPQANSTCDRYEAAVEFWGFERTLELWSNDDLTYVAENCR